MADVITPAEPLPIGRAEGTRRRAERRIDRWRRQGFDTVVRHPSGYCTPANSKIMRTALAEGYRTFDLAAPDALDAVAECLAND